ncbi:allophanate hydrolase subunit 1 [Lipingzhangella sp. LS1_29]|uniref:Allophanate hydrolase subunit 1 n=1 Tax=Lipingzhangella rawalii TaxID=2055835 RepID=A0ABU2H4B4_9ACTN|nr:allophanate hydrolase subunit 1 [Lipingzhangella rawalii]MDS1270148.1 allophanate hydrolase subunit 1 [Lipingzhangella rawalii]
MQILPCGDRGLLVELDTLQEVLNLHAALRADPPPGLSELVPAARTVLLRLDPTQCDPAGAERHLRRLNPGSVAAPGQSKAPLVEIPVVYDGPDLPDAARLLGMSERDLVAAHTAAGWTVAFCGFAPGFGYLVSDDPRFQVPRRGESRTAVPPGSVALAGEFSGVYPRSSPGGWQLIGTTELEVWNLDRDPPGLLRPGVHVRFREEA